MSVESVFLLVLLVVATVLFSVEWVSVDVVALGLVAALVVAGILTPQEAFAGFASETTVVLASIFVLSAAVVQSGAMERLGRELHRLAGAREGTAVGAVMAFAAAVSGFVNNTTATAVLMPAALELARARGSSPSRLLIPLAYATMLGGTCTLIGTSTNLAASGFLASVGLAPYSLFELGRVGLPVALVGIAFMTVAGRRLLPARAPATLASRVEGELFLSEVVVDPTSPLVGRSVEQAALARQGVTVLSIVRADGRTLFPQPESRLLAGDVLVVEASRDRLLAAEASGLRLREAAPALDAEGKVAGDLKLAEAIVMPRSQLHGRSARELRFRQRYGLSLLAVHRPGEEAPPGIADLRLRAGDVLLLEGRGGQLEVLQENRDLWVLGELERPPWRRRKGVVAMAALAAGVTVGAFGWIPTSVALLAAALVVVVSRCLTAEEVYRHVEWRLIVLIGGMTSFGLALQKTGTADLLAGWIAGAARPLGLYAVMAGFVLLTMALTQPMSNAAAALVVLPVAVATAGELGADPRTFAVLVTLAASLSFVTPFEPACLLVYGPGQYRFRDFLRAGVPLSALVFVVLLLLVPRAWPL